jgi:hypothetical protein
MTTILAVTFHRSCFVITFLCPYLAKKRRCVCAFSESLEGENINTDFIDFEFVTLRVILCVMSIVELTKVRVRGIAEGMKGKKELWMRALVCLY